MPIHTTIETPNQRIADLMITALEGGSNYWLLAARLDHPEDKTLLSEKPWYASPELYDNTALKIVFTEQEDAKEHLVTSVEIANGTQLMAEQSPGHFADFIAENDDATTAEVWLQYVIFGEIVYG
jgi:hypothetical protein